MKNIIQCFNNINFLTQQKTMIINIIMIMIISPKLPYFWQLGGNTLFLCLKHINNDIEYGVSMSNA